MDVMELLKTRRTYRRFDEARAIPEEVKQEIFAAARLSSCSQNRQNINVISVEEPELVKKVFGMTRWAGAIPNGAGTPKEGERPVMFTLLWWDQSTEWQFTGADAGLMISNMTLAAWANGVGSAILGAIDRNGIKELVGLGGDQVMMLAVAYGYPAHISRIVPVPESGSFNYWMDENRDYNVPKRDTGDFVKRI